MPTTLLPRLITSDELVTFLRLPSLDALYSLRARGGGPKARRVGRQLVYREDDVLAWLESTADDR